MKNKIISVLLACFLVFSSALSSFADTREVENIYLYENDKERIGVVMTPQMLAALATVAVGAGLIINSNEDIINLGRGFYEYHKDQYESVSLAFNGALALMTNGKVSIKGSALNYITSYLNNTFGHLTGDETNVSVYSSYQQMSNFTVPIKSKALNFYFDSTNKNYVQVYYSIINGEYSVSYGFYVNGIRHVSGGLGDYRSEGAYTVIEDGVYLTTAHPSEEPIVKSRLNVHSYLQKYGIELGEVITLKVGGKLNLDNFKDSYVNEDLHVNLPSNVGSLVGGTSSDVINGNYDVYVPGGTITVPNVDNPSIGIGGITDIPMDDTLNPPTDTPTDTPTSWDWLINLVVPGETYFTDTFAAKLELAQSKLPFLDLTPLQKLAVGETPFPNIDIKIMGSNVSRILNSDDTLNKVVSFFRPIIQSFVSVFMLLYGYNQIYFLIRGTYPIKIGRGKDD